MSSEFILDQNTFGIVSEERTGDPSKVVVCSVSDKPTTTASLGTQLPEFVRQDHPKFVEFLKTYYDWLDIKGNTSHEIKRVREYADIDYAIDEFQEALHRQFLVNIPRNVLTNKAPLLKNIRQFYRSKGTEKSFQFFFRTLYDSPAEFYYPRQDILKLSDGKYIRQKSIRISLIGGDPKKLQNATIIGRSTGTQAFVDKCRTLPTPHGTYYELFLNVSSITGVFEFDEKIDSHTTDGTLNFTGTVLPIVSKISLDIDPDTDRPMSGSGYQVGDAFLVEQSTGKMGVIQVSSINQDGSIKKMTVKDFGVVYSKSSFSKDLGPQNSTPKIKFSVSSAANKISLSIEQTESVLEIAGTFSAAEKSHIAFKFSPQSILRIVSDNTEKYFRIKERFDFYANKIVFFLITIGEHEFPSGFESDISSVESVSGLGARVNITPGVFCEYSGYYISNNGQPSESKYIQDGEFYQQFSYVVYNKESAETYRTYLKDMVHPLGLKFYGGFRDPSHINASIETRKTAPVIRKFQQHPRQTLFKISSIPNFVLIKNDIPQKQNVDFTILKTSPIFPSKSDRYVVKFFNSPLVSTDSVYAIYRNDLNIIVVASLEFEPGSFVSLPINVRHTKPEEQLLPHALDIKAPQIEHKAIRVEKSPALDGIKHSSATQKLRLCSRNHNTAGASLRSIYRDRFRYIPNEFFSVGLQDFIQRLNIIEAQRASLPAVYPDYNPINISYTPSSESSISRWLDSFDDNGQEVSYNTYHADCEKTPNVDNTLYWGDLSSPAMQFSNTQIRHFKHIIPKSLERGDVPEILVIRNGTSLRDNYDYLIVDKSHNTHGNVSIRLLHTQTSPSTSDVFEVIYRDINTKRITTKRLHHEPNVATIEIPYPVSLLSPNLGINIMPDAIVTRGISIE